MGRYRKILAVLDGVGPFEPILEQAVSLARDQNAALSLLLAIPPDPSTATVFGGLVAVPTPRSQQVRRALALAPDDIGFTYRVEPAVRRTSIEREVREGGVDLVVMGHGHRFGRWVGDRVGGRARLPRSVHVLLV